MYIDTHAHLTDGAFDDDRQARQFFHISNVGWGECLLGLRVDFADARAFACF